MKRVMCYSIWLVLLALVGLTGRTANAAPRERCFAETGFCVSGAVLDYWERNGGLPVFGYPISPLRTETIEETWTGPTQWFERDRLEDHANEGQGVLAGRLGARYLELTGRPWQRGNEPASIQRRCLKVPETGHNVCAPFNDMWQSGGIERFGYPLTDAFEELIEGKPYLVQYFERRRMEYHPEHVGTPYAIQLGLLGRDIYTQQPNATVETFSNPDGAWSIQYPGDLLHVEYLGDTLLLISDDRSTFVAVDSYFDPNAAYGNTGEDLRNRARDTLARIYGRAPNENNIVQRPGNRWQTGVSFTTERGSKGVALYEQRGWTKGNYRVNGVLIGYKAADEPRVLPLLQATRDSFTPAADPTQVLIGFLELLHTGRYNEAAQLYGGSYAELRLGNPDIPVGDQAALLERGCTRNGLACLPVRQINSEYVLSPNETVVIVEMARADGSPFARGTQTEFAYTVKLANGRYTVQELPPYVS